MKPNGEKGRKKNIIRERETGKKMERKVLERKSIVFNCIPNMGNSADIRFFRKACCLW